MSGDIRHAASPGPPPHSATLVTRDTLDRHLGRTAARWGCAMLSTIELVPGRKALATPSLL